MFKLVIWSQLHTILLQIVGRVIYKLVPSCGEEGVSYGNIIRRFPELLVTECTWTQYQGNKTYRNLTFTNETLNWLSEKVINMMNLKDTNLS